MVQFSASGKVKDAAASTTARIGCRIYQSGYPGMNQRARTHRTRLQRHIERRVWQPVVADRGPGSAEDEHFGVGARIMRRDRCIARFGEYLPSLANEYRADWDLAFFGGAASERQRTLHKARIAS